MSDFLSSFPSSSEVDEFSLALENFQKFLQNKTEEENNNENNENTIKQQTASKRGYLFKRGAISSLLKRRLLVLDSRALQYFHGEKDKKPRGEFLLEGARLVKHTIKAPFSFEIHASSGKVGHFQCSALAELLEWTAAIEENIRNAENLIALKSLSKEESLAHLAVLENRKSSPSPSLMAEPGEDFYRRFGLPFKATLWRRELPMKGILQAQLAPSDQQIRSYAQLFEASDFLPSEDPRGRGPAALMKSPHAVTTHNTVNAMVWGAAAHGDLDKGALQIVHLDCSDSSKVEFAPQQRFGDLRDAAETIEISPPDSAASIVQGLSEESILSLPCRGEVVDLSWLDDRLAVASSGGIAALFSCDPTSPPTGAVEPLAVYGHTKSFHLPIAAPGKFPLSSRVTRLAIQPVSKQNLLSIANQHFYLWDLERSSKPLYCESGSAQPLLACAWNPNSINEFILGGSESSLKMLDSRILANAANKCVTWQVANAHSDFAINTLAWSPFVPHWIASGGSDGAIRVWDTRFGSEPVRVLNRHENSILSLAWSKSHCELLLSGSADRTARLWNLRNSPHYLVYTSEYFGDSVFHAQWNNQNPLNFWAAGNNGEITAGNLGKEFMNLYCPYKTRAEAKTDEKTTEESKASGPSEVAEREIETLIYQRDFHAAWLAIANLALQYWTQGSFDWASAILKLTSPSLFQQTANENPIIAAANQQSGSLPHSTSSSALAPSKAFSALLHDLSRFIPPSALRLTKVDSFSHDRIQFLKLHLALVKLMAAGKYRDIIALEKEICSHLDKSALSPAGAALETFDSQTLCDIIMAVLPFDHIKGLELAIKIGKTLKENGNFGLFFLIAKYVFSPTIYEKFGPPVERMTNNVASGGGTVGLKRRGKTISDYPLDDDDRGVSDSSDEESKGAEISRSESEASRSRKPVNPPALSRKPSISRQNSNSTLLSSVPPTPSRVQSSGPEVTGASAASLVERELRNPKVVLSQLQLLYEIHLAIVEGFENSLIGTVPTPAPVEESANQENNTAPVSAHRDPAIRWNPYAAQQPANILPTLSAENFSLPAFSSPTAKAIIRLLEDTKEHRKILPASIHFFYFSALIQQNKYDIGYILATKLSHSLRNYSISLILNEWLSESLINRFIGFLEKYMEKDLFGHSEGSKGLSSSSSSMNPQKISSYISKYTAALLTIINILYNCEYLPNSLFPVIQLYFPRFIRLLEKSLEEILYNKEITWKDLHGNNNNNPGGNSSSSSSSSLLVSSSSSSSSSSSKDFPYSSRVQEVKTRVETIQSNYHRIKNKLAEEPFCLELIEEFTNLLGKYKNLQEDGRKE